MKKSSFSKLRGLGALSLCLALGLARAQQNPPLDADPPDRAARLSLIRGDVSLQPAGEEEWTTAILNRPLTTGDKLWTDQGARAEIQMGSAAIRLASETGFSFLNVDDDTIQMRITAGIITVSVRALAGNEQIEIDTPNLALSVLRPGNYRVEVNDAGDTSIVKVSEGEAEASGGGLNVIVHAQEVATFRGIERLDAQYASLGAPDEFDSWSLDRDERAATSRTAQYVAPDVTGYQDLDDNGTWSSEPEYGYVWTPRVVAVDWSPYRYGRWAWVGPWGWTWIDDAPWGYAPFHYGRWAQVRHRWCWVPGPRHVRAVYAPALVGWAGRGNGVAWFPLGPREVYVPARRYSHRYLERVNVSNTANVNRTHLRDVYENRATNVTYRNRVASAVTAVTRATFTSAERVGGRRIRVNEQEMTGTPVTAMAPRIEPVRESRLGAGDARRNVRVPPQSVVSRQVIVKRDPPPSGSRFARNVAQAEVRREQADRPARQRDVAERNETVNGRESPNRAPAPSGIGAKPVDAQPDQAGRMPAVRLRPDRPPHDNQDRPITQDRQISDRLLQREQLERHQQARQAQQTSQPELQQRAQREQRDQREYQERQLQQQHQEQPRRTEDQVRELVERHQARQPQETRQAPPQQREQRERSEPAKPSNDNPQPQRDSGNDRRGPREHERR